MTAAREFDDGGEQMGRDVSRSAEEIRSMLEAFESSSSVGLGFVDRDFQVVRVNPVLAAVVGGSAEEHVGRSLRELAPALWPQLEPLYRRVLDNAEPIANIEIVGETVADPGRLHHWLTNLYPVWMDDEITGIGVVAVDITERKNLEAELQDQAVHDALTGLPNRALLLDRAHRLLASARRDRQPATVLLIDLDNFKLVNAGLGHPAGDELLVAVAKRLAGAMHAGDGVFRLGGDEFVVLADPAASDAAPALIAERVRDVLRPPFDVCGRQISITASIGVASHFDGGIEELLRDADIAAYRAKAEGKDSIVFFAPEMQERDCDRLQLEIDLRQAIENGEFVVVYQPVIDVSTRTMIGVEALVRWEHPTRGRLAPGDFLPLAEENGTIVEIGRLVLREACLAEASRQAGDRRYSLAVNLSTRQLESPQLIESISTVLEETGFDPSMLVLEITETTLMKDADTVVERLKALKDLGVRLAVDDFGTGYCSLSYLRQFPVDILKIDQSFVAALQDSPEQAAIVRSLIELGKALKLEIVAEGVEVEAQLRILDEEYCNTAQGFLFAPPLDRANLELFRKEWVPREGPSEPSPRHAANASRDDPLVAAANRAISLRSIRSVFQPLVHLPTTEVVGYEALTRGPTGSPIESPIDLLQAARAAGRLTELDWLCASTAYDAAVAAGLHVSTSVFLNFEPSTLLEPCPPDLLTTARQVIDRLRVFVEVKEEMLTADPGGLFDALAQVREIGWGVALDNAAARPATLALLPLIHPDVIKIDLTRLRDRLGAIAQIGDGLRLYAEQTGATILAEGIENADDVLRARSMGALYGQGWYFGEPGPIPENRAIPRAVFPLLEKPTADTFATPFEVVSSGCPTAISEKRFLSPIVNYLQTQAGSNIPPGLLLSSFPSRAGLGSRESERLRRAIDRAAFAVVLGAGLRKINRPNSRIHEVHPGDAIGAEWNVIVLGSHYSSAFVARDLGDSDDAAHRRFEYAVTHDRELILLAARALLRRVNPRDAAASRAVGMSPSAASEQSA